MLLSRIKRGCTFNLCGQNSEDVGCPLLNYSGFVHPHDEANEIKDMDKNGLTKRIKESKTTKTGSKPAIKQVIMIIKKKIKKLQNKSLI